MSARIDRIPITLLTGFLGSGKTTLLANLLREQAFARTAVLINEIGAVGLDQQLVWGASETMRVLENGCVCCSVRGDLAGALETLYWDRLHRRVPRFDRVVVETTGLADPGPVLQVVQGTGIVAERYRWSAIVCIVDALAGEQALARRIEPARQAAMADVLVLSKSDLAPAASIAALQARLTALNPVAPQYVVAHGAAPAGFWRALADEDAVLTPEVRRLLPLRHAGAGPARIQGASTGRGLHLDDVASFSVDVPEVSREALETALTHVTRVHADLLLRAKGAVRIVGEAAPLVVQIVHDRMYPPVALAAPVGADFSGSIVFVVAAHDPGERAAAEHAIRTRFARVQAASS